MEGNQLSDHDNDKVMSKRWRLTSNFWLIISLVVMVLSVIWFFYAIRSPQKNNVKPFSVTSAPAISRDIPIYIAALGNVRAAQTITIRTQLNGLLMAVFFKEGQMVKKGDLLAQIDPRPYEAQLVQYEGNLTRDKALLANAQIDLKRYQTLWKQDSIAQQTLATQKALVEQYQGAIKIDEGLIQSTKVNLIYTRITSPIEGRIGLRLVDAGNFVQTADVNGIAVVNTLNPIDVIFTIPEDNVPEIISQVYAEKILDVQAYDRQQEKLLATGKLITMDNQIDATTGTVRMRARFDNHENRLFPNQFVNINILVNTLSRVTVIPTAAIQHTIKGDFVYLLQKDMTVKVQFVEVGPVNNNDTVINKGISVGQVVIVDGTDKLTEGAKVVNGYNSDTLPRIASNANSRTLS